MGRRGPVSIASAARRRAGRSSRPGAGESTSIRMGSRDASDAASTIARERPSNVSKTLASRRDRWRARGLYCAPPPGGMGGRARVSERNDRRRRRIRESIPGDSVPAVSNHGSGRVLNPTRIAIWAANTALFVLCCWLAAGLVNTAIGGMAGRPPGRGRRRRAARAAARARVVRSTGDPGAQPLQGLDAAARQPVETEPTLSEEELEATRLPLRAARHRRCECRRRTFLGGRRGPGEPQADRGPRAGPAARAGDRDPHRATPDRVAERRQARRAGARRGEPGAIKRLGPAPRRPRRRTTCATASAGSRSRRFEVGRDQVEETMRNPAELFSQARILPKYDNGQMVGVQLNVDQAGQPLRADRHPERRHDHRRQRHHGHQPAGQRGAPAELTESTDFQVNVMGADGQVRTLQYTIGQ